ncbi:collagen alpha-1(XII) chain-like [Scomber japonicus]|uniref:collagen alpha-1(XII) chain-like n=1 Tax=Scomber japonicus TaxID=13676 RepID=UPI002305C4BF|nr:collagen alpha-1(XII) chain-like [Scomber japonicus]
MGMGMSNCKADIVMLVQGSYRISNQQFSMVKSFLSKIVNNFDIGPDKVQIGLVQYSRDPRTEWELNTHQTKRSLLKAINRVQKLTGGKALQHVLSNNFKPDVGMRADSPKIVLLITDGASQDDVFFASQYLRDSGIEIHAIGVMGAEDSDLLVITADPAHVYLVYDFNALHDIVNGLTINICADSSLVILDVPGTLDRAHRLASRPGLGVRPGREASLQGSLCDSKADIVMLVEGSWSIGSHIFYTLRSFLSKIIRNFDIGPDKVQIGLVQYSRDPRTEWELNTHQTKRSLLKAINRVQKLTGGKALQHVLSNNFKPNEGMRADSQKIVLLITDGRSTDDVSLASQYLRDSGIEIYAIGIGVQGAKLSQLLEITADPAHAYMVRNFGALHNIVNDVTINICANSSLDHLEDPPQLSQEPGAHHVEILKQSSVKETPTYSDLASPLLTLLLAKLASTGLVQGPIMSLGSICKSCFSFGPLCRHLQ